MFIGISIGCIVVIILKKLEIDICMKKKTI